MQPIQSSLSLAISRAIADAEVRRVEMSRTLDTGRIAQLLGAQADNARASPLASDQLLALALDAAAQPGEFQAPILDALREPADQLEQIHLRRQVFTQHDESVATAVAKAAPDWVLRRTSGRVRHDPQLLAGVLRSEADLNADLWDHPVLPAEPRFRGLMLACVSALRERADMITRSRIPSKFAQPRVYAEGVSA